GEGDGQLVVAGRQLRENIVACLGTSGIVGRARVNVLSLDFGGRDGCAARIGDLPGDGSAVALGVGSESEGTKRPGFAPSRPQKCRQGREFRYKPKRVYSDFSGMSRCFGVRAVQA